MRSLHYILLSLWFIPSGMLTAQDVETQYLKLQESYTQRVQDISQRYQKTHREFLNKFILALVRVEQGYRDDGELDGVIYCRDLRDHLLLNPEMPELNPEAPPAVSDLQKDLQEKWIQAAEQHQKELDQLNSMLLKALEPYRREFSRQGMSEKAMEIHNLRAVLYEQQLTSGAMTRETETLTSNLSADPNLYPFAYEGSGYKEVRGIVPRTCMIELTPNISGWVNETPTGYQFIKGGITFPANASGPLLQDIARNHMFSAEIAFNPAYDFQGTPGNPVVIFQMGERPDTALFSLTMEGHELYLNFKTDLPPPNRENHRFSLGKLTFPAPTHIVVTYRTRELTAYLNGVECLKLRNEVSGGLKEWKETPIVIGRALDHERNRFILPFRGTLNHVYLKAGELGSRQVVANYKRYLLLFE